MNKTVNKDELLKLIFGNTPKQPPVTDSMEMIQGICELSRTVSEMLYVIDFKWQNICHIANYDFCMHGYTCREVIDLDYEFFLAVIHPEDIRRWAEIQKIIMEYLCREDIQTDDIKYFSYTCRIRQDLFYEPKPRYVMIFNRFRPVWINGRLRLGICTLGEAVSTDTGHLTLHSITGANDRLYSEKRGKWYSYEPLRLSERERLHLALAKQGKMRKEIAEIMNISVHTVDREREDLFERIEIHEKEQMEIKTVEQAVLYATNRSLIYKSAEGKTVKKTVSHRTEKHEMHLTPDILAAVQTELDKGRSIRSIYRDVHFSAAAISRAVKQGKLTKKQV
ncbi:MAG: helix-turn-helix transcriptional regulator [Prevotellaceae bacterium]|nr:helix-turn-helix transcriptional regulator [Prevotellaceae bacterium]